MPNRLTWSQQLSTWTNELDKIVNHVLGYLIAFTGLIAIADVIGNQRISSTEPGLFWTWVIVQGLGLDFQILTLIRRLPKLWSNKGVFWANIAFITLLVMMLIIVGSVFVEHDTTTTSSVESAMKALGFPHWLFVWQRSLMSALLIVIFGIDRAMEVAEHERSRAEVHHQPMLPPNLLAQEQLDQVIDTVYAKLHLEMRSMFTEIIREQERTTETKSEPVGIAEDASQQENAGSMTRQQRTSSEQEQWFAEKPERNEEQTTGRSVSTAQALQLPPNSGNPLAKSNEAARPHQEHPLSEKRSQGRKRSQKAEKAYHILKANPNATLEEIEQGAQVNRSYASELRKKLRSEIEAEERTPVPGENLHAETDQTRGDSEPQFTQERAGMNDVTREK